MIETLILSTVIAAGLLVFKAAVRFARPTWRHLVWWERTLLLVAFLPWPGAADELLLAWVLRRGYKRVKEAR